jgi:hypothetical protein
MRGDVRFVLTSCLLTLILLVEHCHVIAQCLPRLARRRSSTRQQPRVVPRQLHDGRQTSLRSHRSPLRYPYRATPAKDIARYHHHRSRSIPIQTPMTCHLCISLHPVQQIKAYGDPLFLHLPTTSPSDSRPSLLSSWVKGVTLRFTYLLTSSPIQPNHGSYAPRSGWQRTGSRRRWAYEKLSSSID